MTEGAHDNDEVLEGEVIEPSASLPPARPPGRRPVAPLHVIPPLTDADVEILSADPAELLRRRAVHYLRWADALISTSPSKINRVAFGVESQRRMISDLLKLSIPPSRLPVEPFGQKGASTDEELLAMLASLGPDLRQAIRGETHTADPAHDSKKKH